MGGPRSRPLIDVVGLGPAGPDLITRATADLLLAPNVRLRTGRHPAAAGLTADTFDHLYETHDTFDAVYEAIVDDLVAAATRLGHVVYAVPGSPRVAEHTVELLIDRGAAESVDVQVHAALSFLDLTWIRLGVDPLTATPRIVDGHRFSIDAAGERGPLLVAQCHDQTVLSEIKLSVDEPGDAVVTVLQRLGAADERIFDIEWHDLDRSVDADHLTSLWIPKLAEPVASEFARFDGLVRRLRAQCPWDGEQTHASLRRYLLEESYETIEALDTLDAAISDADNDEYDAHRDDQLDQAYADLEEELGDVLYQIFFHAILATEQGRFTVADVARSIHDKLYDRHPHVFGGGSVSVSEVSARWEAAKKVEKNRSSVMDGIPAALPALLYATKVQNKAESVGAITPPASPLVDVRAAVAHLEETCGEQELADLLTATVALCRSNGVDAESAVRQSAAKTAHIVRRFEADEGDQIAPISG